MLIINLNNLMQVGEVSAKGLDGGICKQSEQEKSIREAVDIFTKKLTY